MYLTLIPQKFLCLLPEILMTRICQQNFYFAGTKEREFAGDLEIVGGKNFDADSVKSLIFLG